MLENRRDRSASPTKRSAPTPIASKAASFDESLDDDDDDDEETLQLKLAAIEARLKLKKLQKAKAESSFDGSDADSSQGSRPLSSAAFPPNRPASRIQDRERRLPRPENAVQVPGSPTRRTVPVNPKSPSRVLLGIDKGLNAKDVSLRKPPSVRNLATPRRDIFAGVRDDMASRAGNHNGISRPSSSSSLMQAPVSRPKSFNERISESRVNEKERAEAADRRLRSRSNGFVLDKEEMDRFHAAAESPRQSSPVRKVPEREFSRDDVIRSFGTPGMPRLLRRNDSISSTPSTVFSANKQANTPAPVENHPKPEDSPGDPTLFEGFSSLNLSKRILPHQFLKRKLEGKNVFLIPDLLRDVVAPDFDVPDVDGDYIVFGVIGSKSEPKEHKQPKGQERKSADETGKNNDAKYMVLTLTDLKWSIDVFLFGTAFSRYYKLSPGTVIAILNPSIMPPPPGRKDTNKFSLTLSSDGDTVLEIGTARDLGFCKAVRKDGKTCDAWIDTRKMEFCDFHIDVQIQKTKAGRMEVNSGITMFAPGGRSGSRISEMTPRSFGSGGGGRGRGAGSNSTPHGLKPDSNGATYDRATGSTLYISSAPKPAGSSGPNAYNGTPHPRFGGRSAASLIDADTEDPFIAAGNMSRGTDTREERMRKRLAEQAKEKDIARRLGGGIGGGMGAAYLKVSSSQENASGSRTPASKLLRNLKTTGSAGGNDSPLNSPSTTSPSHPINLSSQFTSRSAHDVSLVTPASHAKDHVSRSENRNSLLSSLTSSTASSSRKRVRHDSQERVSLDLPSRTRTPGRERERDMNGNVRAEKVVKKTRFVTERGIREAGRESLGASVVGGLGVGNEGSGGGNDTHDYDDDDDDDDDELEIIGR